MQTQPQTVVSNSPTIDHYFQKNPLQFLHQGDKHFLQDKEFVKNLPKIQPSKLVDNALIIYSQLQKMPPHTVILLPQLIELQYRITHHPLYLLLHVTFALINQSIWSKHTSTVLLHCIQSYRIWTCLVRYHFSKLYLITNVVVKMGI